MKDTRGDEQRNFPILCENLRHIICFLARCLFPLLCVLFQQFTYTELEDRIEGGFVWATNAMKTIANHILPHIYKYASTQDMVFQKNRASDGSLLHSPCPFELSLWVIFGSSAIDSAKVAYLRVLIPPSLHSLPPHQITP